MVHITPKHYQEIADWFCDKVDWSEPDYKGIIEYSMKEEGIECKLDANVRIYLYSDGELKNIVPLWWEFKTDKGFEGSDILNDFSFETMKEFIS